MWSGFVELGAVRAFEPADIACELDGGNLHSETEAQVRQPVFPGIFACHDFAFYAAIAESPRHQDTGYCPENFPWISTFQILSVDPDNFHPAIISCSTMRQRF